MSSRALRNAISESSSVDKYASASGLVVRQNSQDLSDTLTIEEGSNGLVAGPINIKNNGQLIIKGNLSIL
jgi:hypothetical protein